MIVSTDNKTDQQEQLFNRINEGLGGADVTMLKVSDKDFSKQFVASIKNKDRRLVIFCLDNASQIDKLIKEVCSVSMRVKEFKEITKLAIIHDEADVITKEREVEILNDSGSASHNKWIELKELINTQLSYIDLKRIFVTATPENTVMLYEIESPDLMKLEVPSTYVGYRDIQHTVLEDDLDVVEAIKNEVARIKTQKTFEAILYCIERKLVDGHETVLKSLIKQTDAICHTYNGSGISTYMPKKLCKEFEKQLEKMEITWTNKSNYYKIQKMSIRAFYTVMKNMNQRCVITIGKDLICRGISYVGTGNNPITATTMFYKPGMTMHAVGVCQTIGRITGCAMPNLERRLYAPQDVYDTYMKYNYNQEMYIKSIEEAIGMPLTRDVIANLVFQKYKRNIDRPKLKLRMAMSDDEVSEDEDGYIDGVKLSNLSKWMESDTLVGKMLRYLYDCEGDISVKEFKEGVDYKGSDEEFVNNIHGGRGNKTQYGKLWINKNNIVKINPNIKEYIDNNL